MEPDYPGESWCLFRSPRAGSRDGRILLVQYRDISDPAYAGRFTVKRYRSERVVDPETSEWRHLRVRHEPLTPIFPILEIRVAQEDEFQVIAELVQVLA